MAKILGVGGSPRKNGNSDILLSSVLSPLAEAGFHTQALYLRDLAFSGCTGCERCRTDKICTGLTDDLTPWYETIEQAVGLVLVSPCYHYNITSLMKAFIDRLYCYYDFTDDHPRGFSSRLAGRGKQAVVTVVGEQTDPRNLGYAREMMALPLEALGYNVVSSENVYGLFQPGKAAREPGVRDAAAEQGRRLLASLQEE